MIRAGTKAFQYIPLLPAGLVCLSPLMVGFVTVGNRRIYWPPLIAVKWESRSWEGVSEQWKLD